MIEKILIMNDNLIFGKGNVDNLMNFYHNHTEFVLGLTSEQKKIVRKILLRFLPCLNKLEHGPQSEKNSKIKITV